MAYRARGLAPDPFVPLFKLTDSQLASQGAVRRFADEPGSYPCRVSLEDASPGEELLLLPFRHHDVPSPYQASGPIYVRRNAVVAYDQVDEIPRMQRRRLSSVRAYDASGFLVDAEGVPGDDLDGLARRFLENPKVDYLHVHNARPGCFAFRIDRA